GDFVDGFQIALTRCEREGLAHAVRPFGLDPNLIGAPRIASLRAYAPTWRYAVFEHFKQDSTMPGVDAACLTLAVMVMFVGGVALAVIAPGAPRHPEREAQHDRRGGQLKVRFIGFEIEMATEVEPAERDGPHDSRVRDSRRKPQQHSLRHGATNGDDERGH